MRYGSVCSGIEAASVAWGPLGWEAAWFAEIEPFPSAVLAHHYPDVENRGDFTGIHADASAGPIDLLVGGTPCQSFSVAGLRKGLADPRGNLALEFLRLADALRPDWLVWENVPGVLSSNGGRDFGSFLGALGQLGYGWAYRVLDAQYFGVPQRRRRVFVVGHLGDWRRAAAVLFERHGLSGHPPPRREAGPGVAPSVTPGARRASGQRSGELFAPVASTGPVAGGQTARYCKGPDSDVTDTLIAHTLRAEGFDASEDGTGRGTPLVPVPIDMRQASRGATFTNNRRDGTSGGAPGTVVGEPGDPAPSISLSHPPAVAYSIRNDAMREGTAKTPSADAEGKIRLRDPGMGVYEGVAPTVDCGAAHAVAYQCHGTNVGPMGTLKEGVGNVTSGVPFVVNAAESCAVKDHARRSETARCLDSTGSFASSQGGTVVAAPMAVRRLTPEECESLQGFPRGFTRIPWKGRDADQCPDGPRYKALGNSMAVPVMRWIGERIEMVRSLNLQEQRP